MKKETPHILIEVASSLGEGKTTDGEVHVLPEKNEITGDIRIFGSFASRYGGEKVYFAARFNQSFSDYRIWAGDKIVTNMPEVKTDILGIDLGFEKNDKTQVIELQQGISYVNNMVLQWSI